MTVLAQHLTDALDRIDRSGQRRRLVPTTVGDRARLGRAGRTLVDFSSNDYLGLAGHPLLAERSAAWALRLGSGSGGSRLVTGTRHEHLAIEARIARFKGTEAALLFSSGWQLNAAILAALLKAPPRTLLFTDRLIHNSLHAGATGHRQLRFRHNDLDHLEQLLAAHRSDPAAKLIVTESVFSMDGDRIDLPALAELARAHDAFLYLDEAHAAGVLGQHGAGLSAAHPGSVDLVMGTFSKAFGCFGAYVAGSQLLIDYLVNSCGGFLFSTAPPPAMLGAIDAALEIVPQLDDARARLAAHGDRLRARLTAIGLDHGASSTQIVPVIVGDSGTTLRIAAELEARHLLVAAIRPPTVPRGSSRLRIALRATHDAGDIDLLADLLQQALR